MHELHQRSRPGADRPAEEVGGRRPERTADRHGVAPVAPALRPRDRLRPLRLQVRAGRAVEEGRLELAPAALEVDPRELGGSSRGIARDRRDRRAQVVVRAVRVVAADALLGRAPEEQPVPVEVRVRARRRVHDRVGAVDEVELVVSPARLFRAFVLAVADLGRPPRERLAGVRGVEVELDHLPVAFVQVVPVVVDVEEPVLQGELPGVAGLGRDVGVHRRLVPLGDAAGPSLVAAARGERVPGEVEVVVVEPAGEIAGGRPDLDQIRPVPGATERNGRLAEERVDVERLVGLAGAALLLLLDEPDLRRVALGERLLVARAARAVAQAAEHRAATSDRRTAALKPPAPAGRAGRSALRRRPSACRRSRARAGARSRSRVRRRCRRDPRPAGS